LSKKSKGGQKRKKKEKVSTQSGSSWKIYQNSLEGGAGRKPSGEYYTKKFTDLREECRANQEIRPHSESDHGKGEEVRAKLAPNNGKQI